MSLYDFVIEKLKEQLELLLRSKEPSETNRYSGNIGMLIRTIQAISPRD
jgi:hypothetical protein